MIRQLRAVWDAPPASPAPPRRVWRDYALIAAVPVAIAIETALRWATTPGLALSVVVLIALLPVLLMRRTRPLIAFAIAFVSLGAVTLIVGDESVLYTSIIVGVFPYALVRWGSGRGVLVGLAAMLTSYIVGNLVPPIRLDDAIGGGVVLVIIMSLALTFRFRARARQRDVEQVRLLEREHLARDLHDSVAHHVSAIAVTAQAGIATAASNPAAAIDALSVIEREASLTLADMRGMVHLLRHDNSPSVPANPRLSDLDALLHRENGGPPVRVQLIGVLDSLPPAVATAVYRLVQEAVTNSRRHAQHASEIAVRIERDASGVRVDVTDNGQGAGPVTPGFGITGMAERAALLGGTCTAGRASGGGFAVSATLPMARGSA